MKKLFICLTTFMLIIFNINICFAEDLIENTVVNNFDDSNIISRINELENNLLMSSAPNQSDLIDTSNLRISSFYITSIEVYNFLSNFLDEAKTSKNCAIFLYNHANVRVTIGNYNVVDNQIINSSGARITRYINLSNFSIGEIQNDVPNFVGNTNYSVLYLRYNGQTIIDTITESMNNFNLNNYNNYFYILMILGSFILLTNLFKEDYL